MKTSAVGCSLQAEAILPTAHTQEVLDPLLKFYPCFSRSTKNDLKVGITLKNLTAISWINQSLNRFIA
jgi:hypothetical protein